jgi:predicted nucleic acid-binding Zn ribbon protein
MPTYVYRFIDTGETIEVRQSFDDEPLTQAPHPSDGTMRPVKKVFTPVGITFKGSGFYKTDSGGAKKPSTTSSTGSSSESSPAAAPSGDSSGSGSAATAGKSDGPSGAATSSSGTSSTGTSSGATSTPAN